MVGGSGVFSPPCEAGAGPVFSPPLEGGAGGGVSFRGVAVSRKSVNLRLVSRYVLTLMGSLFFAMIVPFEQFAA